MLLSGMPAKFEVAEKDTAVEGIVVDVDSESGKARGIRRIRESAE
jgi:calcineurin-like phosphoesterase